MKFSFLYTIVFFLVFLLYNAFEFIPDISFSEVKKTPASIKKQNWVYIGENSFHHYALKNLEKINVPFVLILIDAHSDLNPLTEKISCGNWVNFAFDIKNLKRVIWLGGALGIRNEINRWINVKKLENFYIFPAKEIKSYFKADADGKIFLNPSFVLKIKSDRIGEFFGFPGFYVQWFSLKDAIEKKLLIDLIRCKNIYVSIDLDVLSVDEAGKTPWGNGVMKWDDLFEILRYLHENFNVVGMDVCGPKGNLWRLDEFEKGI
ncbi:MAG: arginase family protein [Elusimicrobia bacterium]|nr:arginase family protein [Elusimicrobiota bacterium]